MEFVFSTRLQNEGRQLYQKYVHLLLRRFLTIYNGFLDIIGNFYFPDLLLIVVANRCKVLKIFISKVTAHSKGPRLRSGET